MKINKYEKISIIIFSIFILLIGYFVHSYFTGKFEEHNYWVNSVAINNQNIIVSTAKNDIFLWKDRKCIARLKGHAATIKSANFSKNGKYIVSGGIDKSIKIWSLSDKKLVKSISLHSETIIKTEFANNDNYIISSGYDDKLFVWDWKNDEVVKELDIVVPLYSINTKEELAYIDTTSVLTIFDLKTLTKTKELGKFRGAVEFVPNKDIIVVKDSIFTFIDLNTNTIVSKFGVNKKNSIIDIRSYKFTPTGDSLVLGILGGSIETWDWQKQKRIQKLKGHNLNSVADLAFIDKNKLISASGDYSLKIWDLNTGKLIMSLGDGVFKLKLYGVLSMVLCLTLIACFRSISINKENKISAYILLTILSISTLGFALLLHLIKNFIVKYTLPFIWITTALAFILLISIYGVWLAAYIIPFTLALCYVRIITNNKGFVTYSLLIINLCFCIGLSLKLISEGLY